MRKFVINVNGKPYEVEVEEIKETQNFSDAVSSRPVMPAPETKPLSNPEPTLKPEPDLNVNTVAGATNIIAPMPGNIWKILVKVGDTVTVGQPVYVLEALKMENDVSTPVAGKVVAVNKKQGDSVDTGDVVISIL